MISGIRSKNCIRHSSSLISGHAGRDLFITCTDGSHRKILTCHSDLHVIRKRAFYITNIFRKLGCASINNSQFDVDPAQRKMRLLLLLLLVKLPTKGRSMP